MSQNLRFTHLAAIALASALSLPITAVAQSPSPNQASPDNSATNKAQDTTADKQKENASDRTTTQNIRKAIMADKSLSTYAHNVKIVTVNGAVTLTGPVQSDDEKKRIEELANGVLKGSGSLTNNITVKS
jgi:hyperosmotically inducible periplasmic protein